MGGLDNPGSLRKRVSALRSLSSVPMTTESPRTPSADAASEEVAMVPNAMRRRGSWRIAGDLPSSFRYAACLLYTSPSPRD